MKTLQQFRHSSQMGRMTIALIILVVVYAGLVRVLPLPEVVATSVALAGICWGALTWRASIVRHSRALHETRAVLRTVERALMRPIPPRIGVLRAESRYLAADAEAQVGGDMCDLVSTRFGARLLIGDVMGKGLPTVNLAADLLGAFRELARHETTLTGLAERLDGVAHGDRFTTAILAGFPEEAEAAEVVTCGHPPPVLLRGDQATFVDALPPALPLGLLDLDEDRCATNVVPLRLGDRLLFYTDGVTEARDSQGRFFPLADHLTALVRQDSDSLLDDLVARLVEHAGGRRHDDAALLLVQYCPQPSRNPHHWSKAGGSRG